MSAPREKCVWYLNPKTLTLHSNSSKNCVLPFSMCLSFFVVVNYSMCVVAWLWISVSCYLQQLIVGIWMIRAGGFVFTLSLYSFWYRFPPWQNECPRTKLMWGFGYRDEFLWIINHNMNHTIKGVCNWILLVLSCDPFQFISSSVRAEVFHILKSSIQKGTAVITDTSHFWLLKISLSVSPSMVRHTHLFQVLNPSPGFCILTQNLFESWDN